LWYKNLPQICGKYLNLFGRIRRKYLSAYGENTKKYDKFGSSAGTRIGLLYLYVHMETLGVKSAIKLSWVQACLTKFSESINSKKPGKIRNRQQIIC
jgi:hypothetical protein